MHIVLGATGHIGSALAQALVDREEPVIVVSRSEEKARAWKHRAASVAVVDVHDVAALRAVLERGKWLFLLNPPADPAGNTDRSERATMNAILSALAGSPIEKIVAESTYGAREGSHIGDLGVLHELEVALAAQTIPTTIVRGAYYMTNWDASLQSAEEEGVVHTFFPPDFVLPMVSPHDIGVFDARLMMEPPSSTGLHHIEGPARYSSNDVAEAFGRALGKRVEAVQVPRDAWMSTMKKIGFSSPSAESFCGMIEAAMTADLPELSGAVKGTTTLDEHIATLVRKAHKKAA